jgi:hypothetical protein
VDKGGRRDLSTSVEMTGFSVEMTGASVEMTWFFDCNGGASAQLSGRWSRLCLLEETLFDGDDIIGEDGIGQLNFLL